MLTKHEISLLKSEGWVVDSMRPLQIRKPRFRSVATNMAALIVLNNIKTSRSKYDPLAKYYSLARKYWEEKLSERL